MSDPTRFKTLAWGLLGAAVGGYVGYLAFFWFARQGFYALIVPSALMGLTAGFFARRRSQLLAGICGVLGPLLALFTEWRYAPFAADNSLQFFVTHLHKLSQVTWVLVALGAYFSYRFALGWNLATKRAPDASDTNQASVDPQ